jgi:hypothetical protein
MNIDLDKYRAARAEAHAGEEPPSITFGGETFPIPVEAPVDFAVYLAMGNTKAALADLLGSEPGPDGEDSPYDRFWAHRPSVEDLEKLIEQLENVYGVEERKKRGNQGN